MELVLTIVAMVAFLLLPEKPRAEHKQDSVLHLTPEMEVM